MTHNIETNNPVVVQFENANEGRSYPFEDNSVLTGINGNTLPDNCISDLRLVIPIGYSAYLSSVYISKNMLSVCLKVFEDIGLKGALSVTVGADDFKPYMPYRLEQLTGSEDLGGIITFGNIEFTDRPQSFRYNDMSVGLSECVVSRYKPASLRSFIDDRTGESIQGDAAIDFSAYIDSRRTGSSVSLTLTEAGHTELMSSCQKNMPLNACGATPVSSINWVEPDEDKRIVLWFH